MIKNLKENKSFLLLLFLGLYSFAIGLFSNYKELWMAQNGLNTLSISRIITISSIITALILLFFSLRVSTNKLKNGVLISLILKMCTSTILICLNNSKYLFLIKFIMFFDIAFTELILSSIYPLIMSVKRSEEIYVKREVVESLGGKLSFFIISLMLGRTFGNLFINYNICLLFSVIVLFLSFTVLMEIKIEDNKEEKYSNICGLVKYLNQNKKIYLYLFLCFMGGMTWSSILGIKMLTLTEKIGLSTKSASYFILIMGVITNILAILIVKYLKFKNDYINAFFKYGIRVVLYLLMFITNSKTIFFYTIGYLLLTDLTYNFVFNAHFINNMKEEYTLLFTVIKYCISLMGNGIGTFICGLIFNLSISKIGFIMTILGLATYVIANILLKVKGSELNLATKVSQF